MGIIVLIIIILCFYLMYIDMCIDAKKEKEKKDKIQKKNKVKNKKEVDINQLLVYTIDEKFGQPKNYSVYRIVNKTNGKMYIGMTGNFLKRKEQYFNPFYRAEHSTKRLYQEMNRIGESNFYMEVIHAGLTKNEALFLEAYEIKRNDTFFCGDRKSVV